MIGTPEGGEIKRPEDMGDVSPRPCSSSAVVLNPCYQVANDLDIDYLEQMRYGFDPATNTRNRRKLVEAADKLYALKLHAVRFRRRLTRPFQDSRHHGPLAP